MSLRAILEVVIHLDSFRNIDLFFQGLYYIKVSVYNKKNDEVSESSKINCIAILRKSILRVHIEDVGRKIKEDEITLAYWSSQHNSVGYRRGPRRFHIESFPH